MYKLLRSFLFLFDPEKVHYVSMNVFSFLVKMPGIRSVITSMYKVKDKPVLFCGLRFKNFVGLGAGFDKNARYLDALSCMGFGFVEIGTVTPLPQEGNEKPRLFRLPADKALINRMGFNNEGAEAIAKTLSRYRKNSPGSTLIIGGNIGKNKQTPNENAWKDYATCFDLLYEYVDYFVVNVSSPNTAGLRELQEKDALKKILDHLQILNKKTIKPKPILLKIAPDLLISQLDDVVDLAKEINLDGLIVANTTISREGLLTPGNKLKQMGAGGLSGKPLQKMSMDMIQYIHKKSGGNIPIIGSGGIFDAANAKEKLNAGASLIQVWTGFIYEGPSIVKNICRE